MEKDEKTLLESLNSRIGKLAMSMEKTRIDEYTTMLSRPFRFFMLNLGAGIFRGVGMAVGMTLVAAVILFVVAKILMRMVDLPIIGMYIAEIAKFVNQYIQQGIPGR